MEQAKKGNKHKQHGVEQRALIAEMYSKHAGNISAIAKEMGLVRSTVREHIQKMGIKKPIAGGKQRAAEVKQSLPKAGSIKRYILTSAQNNTFVHKEFWENVLTMAEYYGAQILVGTFSYNQNQFGENQHTDTNAGRDGQITDHRNIDNGQHREANNIGQQGRQSGKE